LASENGDFDEELYGSETESEQTDTTVSSSALAILPEEHLENYIEGKLR